MGIYSEPGPRPNPFSAGIAQMGPTFYEIMQKKYERDRIERLENEERAGRQQLAQLLRVNPALFGQLNPQQQQLYFAQNNQNRTFDLEGERYQQNRAGHQDLFQMLHPDAAPEQIARHTPESVRAVVDYRKTADKSALSADGGTGSASASLLNQQYNQSYKELTDLRRVKYDRIIADLPTSKFNDQIIPDFSGEKGQEALKKIDVLNRQFQAQHADLRNMYGQSAYSHHENLNNYAAKTYDPGVNLDLQKQTLEALVPAAQSLGAEYRIPNSDVVYRSNGKEWVRISPATDATHLQMQGAPGPFVAPAQAQPASQQSATSDATRQTASDANSDLAEFSKKTPPENNKGRYAYSKSLNLRLYSNGKRWIPVPLPGPTAERQSKLTAPDSQTGRP